MADERELDTPKADNEPRDPRKLNRRSFLKAGAVAVTGLVLGDRLGNPDPSVRTANAETLNIPPSQEIDGVLTYGFENPLTSQELEDLRLDINSKVDSHEITLSPDRLYGTYYIDAQTYNEFRGRYGESFQVFLKRHFAKMNQMLTEGNAGAGITNGVQSAELRRLVVIQEGFEPEASWHTGWKTKGFKDSDGAWGAWGPRPFRPDEYDWYDSAEKIHYGTIHEMGHTIFHVTDHYALDTVPQRGVGHTDTALQGINTHWSKYVTNLKWDPDDPNLMNLPYDPNHTPKFGSSIMWQLRGRVRDGNLHNLDITIPEGSGFSPNVAGTNVIHVGSNYNGRAIEVYRTDGDYVNRHLTRIAEGTINNGEFAIGNPFSGSTEPVQGRDMIVEYKGVILVKVVGGDPNNPEFAWMDVRAFNEAYERLNRIQEIRYLIQLANNSQTYQTYNWASHRNIEAIQPTPTTTSTSTETTTPTRTTTPTGTATTTPSASPTITSSPTASATPGGPTPTPTRTETPTPTATSTQGGLLKRILLPLIRRP